MSRPITRMPLILSAFTIVALVAGTAIPAWGAEAEPVSPEPDETVVLDPAALESEASEPPVVEPAPAPTGDFADEPDPDPVPVAEPAAPLLGDPSPGEPATDDFDPDVAERTVRSAH